MSRKRNPKVAKFKSKAQVIIDETLDKLGNFPMDMAELDDAMEFVYGELNKRKGLSDAEKDKICFIIEAHLTDYITDISGD